jgi:hypothetical protein
MTIDHYDRESKGAGVTLATAVFALVSTGQLKLRIERCYSFAELRPDLNVDGFI